MGGEWKQNSLEMVFSYRNPEKGQEKALSPLSAPAFEFGAIWEDGTVCIKCIPSGTNPHQLLGTAPLKPVEKPLLYSGL